MAEPVKTERLNAELVKRIKVERQLWGDKSLSQTIKRAFDERDYYRDRLKEYEVQTQ